MIKHSNVPSKYSVLSLFLVLVLTACTHWAPRVNRFALPERDYTYQQPEEIGDGWETASLKEADIDSEKIGEMLHDILSGNDKNIHSILFVKNGKLVLEEYFYGYNRDKLHFLASVSKSITSLLIGIAIDQKLISDVERKAYEFFPDYTGTKWIDEKYPITLQHILTMTAGLDWESIKYPRTDPRHTTYKMYESPDPVRFVLERSLIETPGEAFYYNSGLTILLGEIVKNTSGLYLDEFSGKYLFTPLGISHYHWDKFSDGTTIQTDGGLHLRPRDMAKIGYMILKNGKWKDQQVVSKEWVEECTKTHIKGRGMGYGYQWWTGKTTVNDQRIEVLVASGHGGQKIFIIPTLDLVVVFTSKVFNPKGSSSPEGFLLRYIIPSTMPSISPRRIIQLHPNILDDLGGKYKSNELDVVVPVFREGDKLYTRTSFWDKVELSPESETHFFGNSKNIGEFQLEFIRDKAGEVQRAIAYFQLREVQFDKIQ